MLPLKEFAEQAVQDEHLSACTGKFLVEYGLHTLRIHRPVKQEWMRADFAKLHYSILEFHVVDFLH